MASRLSPLFKRISDWLELNFPTLMPTQNAALLVIASIVGVLAGVGNVAYRHLVHFFHLLIHKGGLEYFASLGEWATYILLPLLPITGALMLLLLDIPFKGEVRGYGLPRFLEAVHLRGALFKARNMFIKSTASAITIGSGGSAGTEGPIAQIGGTIGSVVGQVFKVSSNRLKTLVACGVAGGVAGTFNAPIAGVFFAQEIVLVGTFEAASFTPVVISAGVGVLVSRAFMGNQPVFEVPDYALNSPWEAALFLLLGLAVAFVGVHFTRSFYHISDRFAAIKANERFKPIMGAALTGMVGIAFPQVLGDGYEHIEAVLRGNMPGILVLLLAFAKIYATGLTLGSGNAGGVFAPSLFIGAMLGGAFGSLMQMLMPDLVTHTGLYALAGMGGLLAAATHAPLTAIFLIFEMTDGYSVILPLMFTCVIAYAVARHVQKDSIDSLELTRRGIQLEGGKETQILQSVTVEEAMETEVETIHERMPLREILGFIPRSKQVTFPLVNDFNELCGIISLQDFREVAYEESLEDLIVAKELGHEKVVTLFPDESLQDALARIGYRRLEYLPVVSRDNPLEIVGMLSHENILSTYNKALLRHRADKG